MTLKNLDFRKPSTQEIRLRPNRARSFSRGTSKLRALSSRSGWLLRSFYVKNGPILSVPNPPNIIYVNPVGDIVGVELSSPVSVTLRHNQRIFPLLNIHHQYMGWILEFVNAHYQRMWSFHSRVNVLCLVSKHFSIFRNIEKYSNLHLCKNANCNKSNKQSIRGYGKRWLFKMT